jgi:hypothetical protein
VPTKATIHFFQCFKARVRVMLDEAFEVICRTQKRLNGEKQRKQKGPVVTEIQIAVPPLFASFYKFLARAKTTRPFMSVPVTGKQRSAAAVRKLLCEKCYFGASEATIA